MSEAQPVAERIKIRDAGTSDVGVILHHRRAMFLDMGLTDAAALDRMEATGTTWFRESMQSGLYRGWLAENEDGQVVAGAGVVVVPWPSHYFTADTRRAVILNVYTKPAYRRQGIARKLMQEIIEWARRDKFEMLYLHASDHGRPLYESLGFVANNEMKLKL